MMEPISLRNIHRASLHMVSGLNFGENIVMYHIVNQLGHN